MNEELLKLVQKKKKDVLMPVKQEQVWVINASSILRKGTCKLENPLLYTLMLHRKRSK